MPPTNPDSYEDICALAESYRRVPRRRGALASFLLVFAGVACLSAQLLYSDQLQSGLIVAWAHTALAVVLWAAVNWRYDLALSRERVQRRLDETFGWRPREGQPHAGEARHTRFSVHGVQDAAGRPGAGIVRWRVDRRGRWTAQDAEELRWHVRPRFFRSADALTRHESKLAQRAEALDAQSAEGWETVMAAEGAR
jgi:hypothetical protein